MSLEQTINDEAKSSVKGIMAYLDRWVVTNYMRNQLVNSLLKLVDLKRTTDGNKELRQSRTEKDKYDLETIKLLLRSTLNTLSCTTDKSGESYLLNVIA